MYSKIQQEKNQGFSREAAARHLGLSWRTVDRYWDMNVDEYEMLQKKQFSSNLGKHESVIMDWLERFPDLSAAQVLDWIQEHYEEVYAERTVRRYVYNLRKKHGLTKSVCKEREYGCIPELPPGQQLQADFGEYWALQQDKRRIKLYFVAFILAHSRYKYILWQSRPFHTVDFVRCLECCFEEFGGMPQELVIDQDSLMTVSENHGDIIHTYEFERCKNRHGLAIWLCRKADPESKGMVESCVKFVKYNFARNRCFQNLEQWSKDSCDWLRRTGNGKVHAETKKIPAEVFDVEKKHLKPVISYVNYDTHTDMITTPIRKNNSIRYKSGRYSLPFGTYTRCQTASIREIDDNIEIYDDKGQFLAKHTLAQTPGELVKNNNHARDTSESVDKLLQEAKEALGNTPVADAFITSIRRKRGRYIRDQLQLIMIVAKKYEPEVIRLALMACQECNMDSANDLRDFADYAFRQITIDDILTTPPLRLMPDIPKPAIAEIKVVQRQPVSYMKLVRKEGK